MKNKKVILAVLVAALGYFVDIYDLILFSIVRVPSLRDLGLSDEEILDKGLMLLNLQMGGMLIGGILFGILGDKKGRLSVLFGSILLYSIANLANAYVQTVEQYAILRFIAGIGLAGELGAGITLVSEILPRDKRGYGTTIVASVGVSGALLAWYVADHMSWRTAYIVGGVMGLALLLLRVGVLESNLFEKVKQSAHTKRGDFLSLFRDSKKFFKLSACILIGVQLWYVVGILITLSPEFTSQIGITSEAISAGKAIFYCYFGLIFGDMASGLLSQLLKSRKKCMFIFLILSSLSIFSFFALRNLTADQFYALSFVLGFVSGYWAMFVTIAAEQFGTNLRATVATAVPNFVRGSLVPMSFLFAILKEQASISVAGLSVGIFAIVLSFWGLFALKESFSTDLDFVD